MFHTAKTMVVAIEVSVEPIQHEPSTETATDILPCIADNDETARDRIWKRHEGDEWAAYEALPPSIRRRLHEHAYDAWSVNALMLWKRYRRLHPTAERAERALLRYLDFCERLERRAYSNVFAQQYGTPLPHETARVPVLRYVRFTASRP